MGKNKLERFADIKKFDHVFELTDFQDEHVPAPRGKWHSEIFRNNNPITLELACGKGEYTVELAKRDSQGNYIGVDIKGARIWKGAKKALKLNLDNIRFLRIYIDHLEEYFDPAEADEIWITFPDPYPKPSNENKRLTSPKFLSIYQNVLKKGGHIHFKTDSSSLFNYTRKVLDTYGCSTIDLTEDVYRERPDDPLLTIQTYYEKQHLAEGKKIKYVKFSLPSDEIKSD